MRMCALALGISALIIEATLVASPPAGTTSFDQLVIAGVGLAMTVLALFIYEWAEDESETSDVR